MQFLTFSILNSLATVSRFFLAISIYIYVYLSFFLFSSFYCFLADQEGIKKV